LKKVCQRKIHHDPHRLSADGNFSWEEAECLGACVNAPMVQIFKDTYEDLTPASFEKLIDDIAAGRAVKPGPQVDRQFSAPQGGPATLTDKSLYGRERTYKRLEAAVPQPVPAAPAPIKLAEQRPQPARPSAAKKAPAKQAAKPAARKKPKK
jgi:NADH-quinone oxidoreductase subunit E